MLLYLTLFLHAALAFRMPRQFLKPLFSPFSLHVTAPDERDIEVQRDSTWRIDANSVEYFEGTGQSLSFESLGVYIHTVSYTP